MPATGWEAQAHGSELNRKSFKSQNLLDQAFANKHSLALMSYDSRHCSLFLIKLTFIKQKQQYNKYTLCELIWVMSPESLPFQKPNASVSSVGGSAEGNKLQMHDNGRWVSAPRV